MPTAILQEKKKEKSKPAQSTASGMSIETLMASDAQCGIQTYGRLPVAFAQGAGARLWDVAGKEYLDFLGGLAVVLLGHCHPRVTDAVARQAATLVHSSNLYYIEPQVKLAERLHKLSGGLRAFFCNSGAEANEAAVKLARKYCQSADGAVSDGAERTEIITALDSFHGRTYGSLAATGQPKYQEGFGPMPAGFKYVPLNDIEQLKAAITPRTAAIMLEAIQGESGIQPCSDEYLQAARALCDEHGLLLIFDEVQCGMGRTGKFFAHEWAGVRPDIVTLAKGLGNGVPIGALLAREEVAGAFAPGMHGCTFGGNFLSTAAAMATLDVLVDENLMDNALRVGQYFQQRLREWGESNGVLHELRGRGLMVGVELNQPVARDIMRAALEHGLVLNAVGERILRFLPPLTITTSDVDEAMTKLQAAYQDVTQ
ncbi:MAG TPA: acetylornithine transaminase [Abditibacteriaceae bacterium]|nr:acetylornithine transaminase [Abditibacteriaceae bacterium]